MPRININKSKQLRFSDHEKLPIAIFQLGIFHSKPQSILENLSNQLS